MTANSPLSQLRMYDELDNENRMGPRERAQSPRLWFHRSGSSPLCRQRTGNEDTGNRLQLSKRSEQAIPRQQGLVHEQPRHAAVLRVHTPEHGSNEDPRDNWPV